MQQPPTRMLTYVITGSPRQFHDYCRQHRLNPEACRAVLRPDVLRGVDLEQHRVVYWGDYDQLPEISVINQIVAGRAQRAA